MKKQADFTYKNINQTTNQNLVNQINYGHYIKIQNMTKNTQHYPQTQELQFQKKKSGEPIRINQLKTQLQYGKVDNKFVQNNYLQINADQGIKSRRQQNRSLNNHLIRGSLQNMNQNNKNLYKNIMKDSIELQTQRKKSSKYIQDIQNYKNEIKTVKKQCRDKNDTINELRQKNASLQYALKNIDSQIKKQKQRIEQDNFNVYNGILNENERLRKQLKNLYGKEKLWIEQKNELFKRIDYKLNIEKNEYRVNDRKYQELLKKYNSQKQISDGKQKKLIQLIQNLKSDKNQLQKRLSILQKKILDLQLLQKQTQKAFNKSQQVIKFQKQQIVKNKKINLQQLLAKKQSHIKMIESEIIDLNESIRNEWFKNNEQGQMIKNQGIYIKDIQNEIVKYKQQKQKMSMELRKQRQEYNKKIRWHEQRNEKLNESIWQLTIIKNDKKQSENKLRLGQQVMELQKQKQKLLQQIKGIIDKGSPQKLNNNQQMLNLKNQIHKKTQIINTLCNNIKNMENTIHKHSQNHKHHKKTQLLLQQANQKLINISLHHLNIKYSK